MFFLTVRHLPREESQITKFILDRGIKVIGTLTSTNFCRSPLVQDYCQNVSNDKKPHDFGSIQRVGKRLLRGTYR